MTITAEQAAKLLEGTAPGPWRVGPVDDTRVEDADGYEVAQIDGDYNEPDLWPKMEANARLIAAAPDLARALIDSEAARKLAEQRADASTPPADTWHERRTMLPDGDARKEEG